MRRFYHIIVYSLLLSCFACNSKKADNTAPVRIPVKVYQVQEEQATFYNQYPATVTALNEVQLRPQVSGYITGIYFKDGQQVTKGMRLYKIDQQQYQANVDQYVANLNVAKANLARAKQDADRYSELAKKDAIATQVVDHALADLQAAQMQVSAAQAGLRNVQTGLRYSTISAPMSGTIGISQVKMGAAVTPGVTILNTVSSNNPIAVDVSIDEKQISFFVNLQKAGKEKTDSIFQLEISDGSIYPVPGKLYLLDRAVDPQTGTLKARFTFENNSGLLKPGMNVNLRVKNNRGRNQLLIPAKALVEQMGEYFVYVINDSTVSQKKVVIGNKIGDKVIVESGLTIKDKIATEGVQKLKEGALIMIDTKENPLK